MWNRIRNFFFSVKTYRALSPDLQVRRHITFNLRERSPLSPNEWLSSYGYSLGVSQAIVEFAYCYLEQYSGLEFAYIHPQDQLENDLQWTQVCWFDWETSLCCDFEKVFGTDIRDAFNNEQFVTVGDLLTFLQQHLNVNGVE
jgi:hypothetical protein